MAAPKGNKFWEARSTHGRNPIFSDPEQIADGATEYFQWVESNPLWESKAFHNSGEVVTAELPKMRAMTIEGLCNFLDIGVHTWHDYRKRENFSAVCARVEQIIRQQKFEGASADLLNASIIARDLGLAEKQDHTSSDGSMTPKEASPRDMAKALLAGLQKAAKE